MEIDKIKQYSFIRTDLTIDSCFVQLDKQMMEKYVTSIKDKFGDINKLNK